MGLWGGRVVMEKAVIAWGGGLGTGGLLGDMGADVTAGEGETTGKSECKHGTGVLCRRGAGWPAH